MGAISVTKTDAAERQLAEAIRLFFEDRDPLAIHTLAGAASQLTADLLKTTGLASTYRSGEMIRPERRAEYLRVISAPENFLKHADRDPNDVLRFDPGVSAFFIFAGVVELKQITGQNFHAGLVFVMWFYLKYPDVLADVPELTEIRKQFERMRTTSRSVEDKSGFLDLLINPPPTNAS